MATLEEGAYALTQKTRVVLRINQVQRVDWISIKGGDHEDNPVPYLDVVFPEYGNAQRGLKVTFDAGFSNTNLIRMFTGGIYARGNEDPDALRTQCFTRGRTDEFGVTVEAVASVINPPVVWPPIPAGQFIDFEISDSFIWEADNAAEIAAYQLSLQALIPDRPSGSVLSQVVRCLGDLKGAYRSYKIPARDLSGMMIKAAMAEIYEDCGVSSHNMNDFDDYELAPDGVLVDRGPGSEALHLLMLLRNISHRQAGSGVVHHRLTETRPSGTPAFTYDSTDPLFSRIIDNPGKVRVPFNPLLVRGMTIRVVDSATQVEGNWYLRGHDYEIGPAGDWSYMDLVGGDEFGAIIGVNPEAHFIYWVELEYLEGILTAIIQFDAQSSFDNDGTLTDGDISWDDNQTPNLISGTGFRKTVIVAVADIVEPWIVACTATDETSLVGVESQTIDTSFAGAAVQLPTIGVAADTHGMFSSPIDNVDGWVDHSESSHTAVGLRPPDGFHYGHGLYGYADGHVELTRDGNLTRLDVLAAVGSEIRFIAWDWRNTLVAWILTEDFRLYISLNMDDVVPTFGLYGGQSLATTLGIQADNPIGKLLGLPGNGGVYVFGGSGQGYPLIAYDAALNNHWVNQIALGDILTDGPGSDDLYIYDYTAPGYGGDTMVLANAGGRLNGSVAVYHSNDGPGPSKVWTRATGLPAGLVGGRAILPNGPLAAVKRIAIFADASFEDSVFKSNEGVAYTETTGILPAGFTCNHAIWLSNVLTGLPEFDGIYLLALENAGTDGGVYKSIDELSSEVSPVRNDISDDPWPNGARALQLSLGAGIKTLPGTGSLAFVRDGAPSQVHILEGQHWNSISLPAQIDQDRPRIFCLTRDNWVICDTLGFGNDQSTDKATRTVDGGSIWVDAAIGDETLAGADPKKGFSQVCVDAGGWLWGARSCGNTTDDPIRVEVFKSEDFGATWDFMGAPSPIGFHYPLRIVAHPLLPNIIAVLISDVDAADEVITFITTNRGGSFLTNVQAGSPSLDYGNGSAMIGFGAEMMPSGRILACRTAPGFGSNPTTLWTSDDGGLTYLLRQTITNTDHYCILAGIGNGKIVVVRVRASTNPSIVEVYVSVDQGVSYQLINPLSPSMASTGNNWSAKSNGQVLYLVNGNDATGDQRVYMLTNLEGNGDWVDITYDLSAGGTSWDCMDIVP